MGGTASPLGWNMAYDPIVHGLSEAVGVPTPTYVDDLSALAVGPPQAVRVGLFLLFASHAAGLRVLAHTCRHLRIRGVSPAELAVMDGLPVVCRPQGRDLEVQGLTPELVRSILLDAGVGDSARVDILAGPCHCRMKAAHAAARDAPVWADALAATPFGSS